RYELFERASNALGDGVGINHLRFWPKLEQKLEIAINVSRAYWGFSENYDELVKAVILPEKIVRAVKIPIIEGEQARVVSAGMMHSYGYLFSTLQTDFGLKSRRWLESRVD